MPWPLSSPRALLFWTTGLLYASWAAGDPGPIGVDFSGGTDRPPSSRDCTVMGLALDPSAASSWTPISTDNPPLVSTAGPVPAAPASAPDVYLLELINRTRWNPQAEGMRHDALEQSWAQRGREDRPEFFGDLAREYGSLCAQQPMAFDPGILRVTKAFSQRITAGECWVNGNPHICDGQGPVERGQALGVDIIQSENLGQVLGGHTWPDADSLERVHFGLMVDHYNAMHAQYPLGHRLNLMRPWNVVGISVDAERRSHSLSVEQHFGHAVQNFGVDSWIYVTGVVYEDLDGDDFYSIGEGLEGVTITLSTGERGVTGPAGNYAIPMTPTEVRHETVEFVHSKPDDPHKMRAALERWQAEYRAENQVTMPLQVMASGGPFGDGVLRSAEIVRPVEVRLDVRTRSKQMKLPYTWPTVEPMQMGGGRWVPGNLKVDFRAPE